MPRHTILETSPTEHAQVLAALRRARYGYLLALRMVLLCAAGRSPTEIAAALFCSRSSVYRTVRAWLKAVPQAYGWWRTRWSGATLALTLHTTRGITVSAETMRRWLPALGWVGKRAKWGANDDDPRRVARLARRRWVFEPLTLCEAMVLAAALDSHLLPKVGWAWMPTGSQLEVMTPGQHQQPYRAGALDLATGTLRHCLGARQTNVLFRD